MWQFMAEHGQRRSQSWAPGDWKGGADGQAVRKVMNAVTDCNHIRKQAILWIGGERKNEAHVMIWAALPISTVELLTYNYVCDHLPAKFDSAWLRMMHQWNFTFCARDCFCFWEALFFPIYLQAKKSHMSYWDKTVIHSAGSLPEEKVLNPRSIITEEKDTLWVSHRTMS